jgi:hypothetical protein
MTFDVHAWRAPSAHDPVLAEVLVRQHLEGTSRLVASSDLARVAQELTARFPGASIEGSDRLVVVHVGDDAPDELLEAIPALAWERDLVLSAPPDAETRQYREAPCTIDDP